MKIIGWIGRIIFALSFIGFGVNHFRKADAIADYIPDYIPFPVFWVYFTGVAFILSGISIGFNFRARISGILLAAMLLLFIVILYLPSLTSSKMAIATYAAFIGGALFIAANSKN